MAKVVDWTSRKPSPIPKAFSNLAPAAISYRGELCVFFVQERPVEKDSVLFTIRRLADETWTEPELLTYGVANSVVPASRTPLIVVSEDVLHLIVFHKADGNDTLNLSHYHLTIGWDFDAEQELRIWERISQLPLTDGLVDASLVTAQNQLYLFYRQIAPNQPQPTFFLMRWVGGDGFTAPVQVNLGDDNAGRAYPFVWYDTQVYLFRPQQNGSVKVWAMVNQDQIAWKGDSKPERPGFRFDGNAIPNEMSVVTRNNQFFIAYKQGSDYENVRTLMLRDPPYVPAHESVGHVKTTQCPVMVVHIDTVYCLWNTVLSNGSHQIMQISQPVSTLGPLSSWMRWLPQTVPISHVTLPGTHDSGALDRPPSWNVLAPLMNRVGTCQTMPISLQLRAGIRFLDIRGGYGWRGWIGTEEAIVHHGPMPILPYLPLRELFTQLYGFLDDHPSEFLVVSLKYDPNGEGPDRRRFAEEMCSLITSERGAQYWLTTPAIPTVQEARKKIILLRRYQLFDTQPTPEFGINAFDDWAEQIDPFTILSDPPAQIILSVQDAYDLNWIPEDQRIQSPESWKMAKVKALLDQAALDRDGKWWYINFASATKPPKFKTPTGPQWPIWPRSVAQGRLVTLYPSKGSHPSKGSYAYELGVNDHLRLYLTSRPKGHYGIVVMDFADRFEDLVAMVVNLNHFV
ncbi:uncharacterized protein DSM5745_07946 [Aspergillus mulundensis]|uniref:Phosphatidylinositol-specific phospholipase C X domain-containing protein n=1 Tax=Aspergillus mulundensis TaxID=1810919 RepID=A0A3D8RFX6_9EURO|nr:hypothetical protein DSM5745_07946 [Aspergillus mulundensis]RDW72774.1 hypothetical protein DSM5745_07946 [Aspergillus mulundensis]